MLLGFRMWIEVSPRCIESKYWLLMELVRNLQVVSDIWHVTRSKNVTQTNLRLILLTTSQQTPFNTTYPPLHLPPTPS